MILSDFFAISRQKQERLPQERLSIAVSAMAGSQRAFDMTVEYTRDRKAFGKPILDFQNSRFVLADLKAKIAAAKKIEVKSE